VDEVLEVVGVSDLVAGGLEILEVGAVFGGMVVVPFLEMATVTLSVVVAVVVVLGEHCSPGTLKIWPINSLSQS
jgi:hypothetical protein